MGKNSLPVFLLVLVGLILINLAALDIGWFRQQKQMRGLEVREEPVSPNSISVASVDNCGSICDQIIDQKITAAIATLSGKEPIKETTVVKEKVAQATSQPQVIYVPLGGGGSTTNRDWADVGNAEVYLSLDDYPNVDKVYFEGFIKVKHGNGKAFARLYDVTHKIGVQGGEISTTSENYELVESDSLGLWQGKNLYRVQIKSLNGYETSFDSGRIKIIIK